MSAPSSVLKNSDICLSIRSIDQNRTAERALALMGELQPTRLEWSYVTDRELIARFREITPVFVATLNTIVPAGHAESFTGEPIIAPWMTRVYSACNVGEDGVVVADSQHTRDPTRKLHHRLTPDGKWTTSGL